MTLFEPDLADVPVLTVLQALADETRLTIVREMAESDEERLCGSFAPSLAKATRSHHFKVLREAGITLTRVEGTARYVRLRRDELQRRFPGLLDSVLEKEPAPGARRARGR
jgi:DNA-binding transcriptional ArsR family regulator